MSYKHITRRRCEQCGLHHNSTLQECREPVINTAGWYSVPLAGTCLSTAP